MSNDDETGKFAGFQAHAGGWPVAIQRRNSGQYVIVSMRTNIAPP